MPNSQKRELSAGQVVDWLGFGQVFTTSPIRGKGVYGGNTAPRAPTRPATEAIGEGGCISRKGGCG